MRCPNCGSFDFEQVLHDEDFEFECERCKHLWFRKFNQMSSKDNKIDELCETILFHMESNEYAGCIPTSFNLSILNCSFTTLQRAFRRLESEGKLVSFSVVVRGQMVTFYVHVEMMNKRVGYGNRLNNA